VRKTARRWDLLLDIYMEEYRARGAEFGLLQHLVLLADLGFKQHSPKLHETDSIPAQ
jgi:hypothetical protein